MNGSMDSVSAWVRGLKSGDEEGARQIWNHYFERLLRLAEGHLSPRVRRLVDGEDIAVCAFQSVFRRAARGELPELENRDDLWRLLVVITRHKAISQARRVSAEKRGGWRVRGESAFHAPSGESRKQGIDAVASDEPTAEFVAEMVEEETRLLQLLENEALQQVAIARLEGLSVEEIAKKQDVSTRTIKRKLRLIREHWENELNRLD